MKAEILNQINIEKKPAFIEIWREGSVVYEGVTHRFWLIDPNGKDENDNSYEIDVRWFFQRVPREVRAMVPTIIQAYKDVAELEKIKSLTDIIKECERALNHIPNQKFNSPIFKDTYELASAISKYVKK